MVRKQTQKLSHFLTVTQLVSGRAKIKTQIALLYINYITNKNLLYSTENSTLYSLITHMGKESKKDWIYVYV